jgi:hypothetical protein
MMMMMMMMNKQRNKNEEEKYSYIRVPQKLLFAVPSWLLQITAHPHNLSRVGINIMSE